MLFLASASLFSSCEKAVEANIPKGKFVVDAVFEDDLMADAAVRGIYAAMVSGFEPGVKQPFLTPITETFSLWSDEYELAAYTEEQQQLLDNSIAPNSASVAIFWRPFYNYIFQANMIIESAQKSPKLSEQMKKKVIAESHFLRALSYFYLANIYGDVPLVLTSDYTKTVALGVATNEQVMQQVVDDLLFAQKNLAEDYTKINERKRANRWTATALLARTYLYLKKWDLAEIESSKLIELNTLYKLEKLENVFLLSSQEVILSLKPLMSDFYIKDAAGIQGPATANSKFRFTPYTLSQFNAQDQRLSSWTKTIEGTTAQYKFKNFGNVGSTVHEATVLFRLAEQYLIRAEARAELGKLAQAIEDLDALRLRAGAVADDQEENANNSFKTLAFSKPSMTKLQVIEAVSQERICELFGEFGHRWFDAKRYGENDLKAYFGDRKPNMTNGKAYFPIPLEEINKNKNLQQRSDY